MSAIAIVAMVLLQAPVSPEPLKVTDKKIGTGAAVVRGDQISVEYVGKLENGKVIDQNKGSFFRFIIGLGTVISGWEQGLMGMKVGGVRYLEVPAPMAYGDRTRGPIPANSKLFFTVTLKNIEHPKQRIKVVINKQGTGPGANWDELVELRYSGNLLKGKEFDNNLKNPTPLEVALGQSRLIPGFTLGVLGMKLGETRTITLPPDLGYGNRTRPMIPANSSLVFKITRVDLSTPPKN